MQELVGLNQSTVDPLEPIEIAKLCKIILSDAEYKQIVTQRSLERAKYFDWKKQLNKQSILLSPNFRKYYFSATAMMLGV